MIFHISFQLSNILNERIYQLKAINSLKKGLKKTIDNEKKAKDLYLIGELYRRIGDYKSAIFYFNETLKIKNAPPPLADQIYERTKGIKSLAGITYVTLTSFAENSTRKDMRRVEW